MKIFKPNWSKAREKSRWRGVVESYLSKLIESNNDQEERIAALEKHRHMPSRNTDLTSPPVQLQDDTPPLGSDNGLQPHLIVSPTHFDTIEQLNKWISEQPSEKRLRIFCSVGDISESPSPDTDKKNHLSVATRLEADIFPRYDDEICRTICTRCGASPDTDKPDTPPLGSDRPQGSWICGECGKDWGDGKLANGIDLNDGCEMYRCGNCGERGAVIWYPAEALDTDKPEAGVDDICEGFYGDLRDDKPEELKPCLCGSANVKLEHTIIGDEEPESFVCCLDCGIESALYETGEQAIAAWNTRPIEDKLRTEIATLKAEKHEAQMDYSDAVAEYKRLEAEIATLKEENEKLKKRDSELKGYNDRLGEELGDRIIADEKLIEQIARYKEATESAVEYLGELAPVDFKKEYKYNLSLKAYKRLDALKKS